MKLKFSLPALKAREGRIFFWAASIYIAIWLVADLGSIVLPLPRSLVWLAGYMPIALLVVFYQIGGFKATFKSDWFNTSAISFVALVPVFVSMNLSLFR